MDKNCLLWILNKVPQAIDNNKLKKYGESLNILEFLEILNQEVIEKFVLIPDDKSFIQKYLLNCNFHYSRKQKNIEEEFKIHKAFISTFDIQIFISYFKNEKNELTAHAQYQDFHEEKFLDFVGEILTKEEYKNSIFAFIIGLKVKK